jgi:hypothetical protein
LPDYRLAVRRAVGHSGATSLDLDALETSFDLIAPHATN